MRNNRQLQLSARRRLTWTVWGIVSLQFALAAAIELSLPQVRDPQYAVREQRLLARLAAAPDRPLWVMLGSSRAQLGFRAAEFREEDSAPLVFNFGMPGCGPMMQLVCLERLLARGVRPDLLLVEIMPPMLSWRGGQPVEERLLDGSRLSAAELRRLLPFYVQPRRPVVSWGTAWLTSARRRASELQRLLEPGAAPRELDANAPDWLMDDYGWQNVPSLADAARRRELTLLAANQYDGALAEFELAPGPARALTESLNRCRSESIPVALVLMPEAESFRSLYSARAEQALERFLADLRREYGAQIIDARRWVADEHFSDGHHLLADGAAVFTARFRREALPEAIASRAAFDRRRTAPAAPVRY